MVEVLVSVRLLVLVLVVRVEVLIFEAFNQLRFFFVMPVLFGLKLKVDLILVNVFELAQFVRMRMIMILSPEHVIHVKFAVATKPVQEVGIINTLAALMNRLEVVLDLASLRSGFLLLKHEVRSTVTIVVH